MDGTTNGGWCWRATAWASSLSTSRARGEDLLLRFRAEDHLRFIPKSSAGSTPAALDCYLSLNYVPCPWTLVEGVEKLRPGSLAGMARRKVSLRSLLATAACRRRAK